MTRTRSATKTSRRGEFWEPKIFLTADGIQRKRFRLTHHRRCVKLAVHRNFNENGNLSGIAVETWGGGVAVRSISRVAPIRHLPHVSQGVRCEEVSPLPRHAGLDGHCGTRSEHDRKSDKRRRSCAFAIEVHQSHWNHHDSGRDVIYKCNARSRNSRQLGKVHTFEFISAKNAYFRRFQHGRIRLDFHKSSTSRRSIRNPSNGEWPQARIWKTG